MPAKKKIDFAGSFRELEAITEWFESENFDIDEGIKKFERGLELAEQCKKKLSEVENRIVEIKKSKKVESSQPKAGPRLTIANGEQAPLAKK